MEPGYGGFADLGSILSGGGVDQGAAFTKGATGRASLESAMANARINRDKAMQREKLRGSLEATGMAPAQIDLLETVMRGGMGSDFNSGMAGMGKGQENQGRQIALDELMTDAVDPTRFNRGLAVSRSAPMISTQIDEGYIIDPYGPKTQDVGETEGELADIMANNALVDQRKAATGLSNARTANVNDRTANPDKYKPAPKPSKNSDNADTPPPPAAIKQLKRGARTKFANGQTWTLDAEGKPARID